MYESENKANPSLKVAIKVLNKSLIGNDLNCILEEIRILHRLDHPNIVKYFETYEDSNHMYLIMEYCNGGELFEHLIALKDDTFGENQTAEIMDKLFRAIAHCHA